MVAGVIVTDSPSRSLNKSWTRLLSVILDNQQRERRQRVMAAGDKNEALATKPATATTRRNTKKEPINRSKLGPDYIAPDGGHGWFVALAAGCSNVSDNY